MFQSLSFPSSVIRERNFQLAFFSIVFLVLVMVTESFHSPKAQESLSSHYVPFAGWTLNTVIVVILTASGGLLVAGKFRKTFC